MGHLFGAYLAIAGGLSAGLQVTRGFVRGTGRLLGGDPRGALAEVTAGVVAPAVQVYREAVKLTLDVCGAVDALTGDDTPNSLPSAAPAGTWAPAERCDGVAG
jgi:hypothetical protein